LIDCLVSFIQAYVFTMLSTIFISLAVTEENEHEATTEQAAA
jgi:F-type H+-transporting ATPase subunit a